MDKMLHIVCLHGFSQTSEKILSQLNKIIKPKNKYKLFGFDGTVSLPQGSTDTTSLAYWIYDKLQPLNIPPIPQIFMQEKFYLNQTITKLNSFIKSIGHVDGFIGFSQGGLLLDHLCDLQNLSKLEFSFNFAVFIAASEFETTSSINHLPSLHIYGSKDNVIPMIFSKKLANKYSNKINYEHNNMHIVPSNSQAKYVINVFLDKMHNFKYS